MTSEALQRKLDAQLAPRAGVALTNARLARDQTLGAHFAQRHSRTMLNDWRLRLEPWITPLFRAWWRVSRPKTLGVRAVVMDPQGSILLVRHSYLRGWHLPGGGVENGETAVDAIVREVAEEGGVQATGMPVLIGLYSNHANFANDNIAVYRIDAWTPCEPQESNEISERGFFARDALPEGVTKATLRRLAEHFDGAALSATW